MADVAYDFVIIARQLASNNNFKTAFDMYMCAFEKGPEVKKMFENEFRMVLLKMNDQLAAVKNKAQIFANFERAIKVFPQNVGLLNDTGRYLYRYGYFSEALCHFEKALNIDSSIVSIEKSLNNAKTYLFPRSKFRVLNDTIRNNAYRAAIKSCVKTATDSVLDIDAGTGLLALYANECNPIVTTACESSYTMARLAECVMLENHAHDVVIVNQPSVILKHTDIYGSRSVLLTDMIDAGLIGDYILPSICHAWENLLCKASKIIPGKAEYFVVGVKCDELTKKYKLAEYIKNVLNISKMHVHTTTYFGETYYTEDVNLYENLEYMCEPTSLFTIDFNNYQDVHEKLYKQEPHYAEFTPTQDGEIDMVIGWFNLHLTDDIMLTSNPKSENKANAWQQAVFFDILPKIVRKNESLQIPFYTYGGKLTTVPEMNSAIRRISPEVLVFLNDSDYMRMITKSIGTVCVYLGQTVNIEEVNIADFSPFPLFGILLMRRGANSLICYAKTIDDKKFLQSVLAANSIPENKVSILVSDHWSHKVIKGNKFHVIFSNILDFNGDIDVRKMRIVQHLKNCRLKPGGLCLPANITAMGQLISSNYLEINNKVLDENVGYKMAKHVNRYQVSQAMHLDIARLEYEPLSEEFEIVSCEDMKPGVIKVPILKDGECNAILCWYKVQLIQDWHEVYTNRSNSFVDSMAFMTSAKTKVFKDDEANILRCVDLDGSFKLTLEIEPY